jgi:hypothetical protein
MNIQATQLTSLSDLYRRHRKNLIVVPPHQRGDCWTDAKKLSWWETIKKGGTLSGMITTYQLASEAGDGNKVYKINDGVQRIVCGLPQFRTWVGDPDEADDYLANARINEQIVTYDDEAETISAFFILNATGTMCTPLELTKSLFVSGLTDYEQVWEPMFEKIFSVVDSCLVRAGSTLEHPKKQRVLHHKRRRDSLCLFYRFLTRDTGRNDRFKVAATCLDMTKCAVSELLESKLCAVLSSLGAKQVEEKIEEFERRLNALTAFYIQIWKEQTSVLRAPNNVHLRWWLMAALWMHNVEASTQMLREFTTKIIAETRGRTTLYYERDGQKKSCNFGLGNLTNLTTILRAVDLDLPKVLNSKPKRKKVNDQLLPGVVHSHINAFSANGEGETVPENALENLHRLNRDMTVHEAARLRDIDDGESSEK